MIYSVNHFFTKLFDIILAPFKGLNDFWPVLILSIIISFIILFLLKFISFPNQIRKAKEKIKASIFAIRIYKDFWKVIVLSFFKSLFHTFRYFIINLIPFLIIIPLLMPVFAQMESRYGVRPFKPGETTVIKADFKKSIKNEDIVLSEKDMFSKTMPPVYMDYSDKDTEERFHKIDWKIKFKKEGLSSITLNAFGKSFSKRIVSGNIKMSLSDKKFATSSWWHFLYPSEPLFGENEIVNSISVSYPARTIDFLGIKMHWIIWNLIIVVILILLFKNRFGVEF